MKVIEEAGLVPEDWMSAFEHSGSRHNKLDGRAAYSRRDWSPPGPFRLRGQREAGPLGEDLLFQVLLGTGGLRTDDAHQRREKPEGHEVYLVEDDALIACFDSGEPGAGAGHREA